MKRLFALVGFTYFIALAIAIYFPAKFSLFVSISFAIIFLVSLMIKSVRNRKVIPIGMLFISLAFGAYALCFHIFVTPKYVVDSKDTTVSGVICELPYKSGTVYHYVIKTDSVDVDDAPQNMKIMVYTHSPLEAEPFDRVTLPLSLHVYTSHNNKIELPIYASKGIYVVGNLYDYNNVKVEDLENKPIKYNLLMFKKNALALTRSLFDKDYSSLINAMLFGYRYDIEQNILSNFNTIGISHLIAVSGIHISIIVQFITLIFGIIKLPKRFLNLILCFVVLIFIAFTGFSYSSIRAGIMCIIYLFGTILKYKSDPLNSLGLAVLIVTAINPFAAGDVGLILSFSATLGIILFYDKIYSTIKDKLFLINLPKIISRSIACSIAITIASSIFTIPLISYYFGTISLISILSNLLIVFPATVLMMSTSIGLLLYNISFIKILSVPFLMLSNLILKYILFCSSNLAKIPFASIYIKQPFMCVCISGTLILMAIALLLSKNYELIKIASILSLNLFLIGILSYQVESYGVINMAIIESYNSSYIVLTKDNHAAIISNGTSKYDDSNMLLNYLKKYNIRNIDYMLVSNAKGENYATEENLIIKSTPEVLVAVNDSNLKEAIQNASYACKKEFYFNNNSLTNLWDNVKISSIYRGNKGFINIKINNVETLLCLSGGNIDVLPYNFKNCSILVLDDKTEELEQLNPFYTVLFSDKDGLPNIKNFKQTSGNVLITQQYRSIIFDFIEGNTIKVRREV